MSDEKYVYKKIRLSDLKKGVWEDEYLKLNNEKYYRVRIIGTIVQKFVNDDNSYGAITIDDGHGTIRVKVWSTDMKKITNFEEGDLVEVFSNVRHYDNELYLNPVHIKKITDPNWELVRELELIKQHSEQENTMTTTQQNNELTEKIVFQKIKELSSITGSVPIDYLVKALNREKTEVLKIVREIMERGDIYEPKPGVLKPLE